MCDFCTGEGCSHGSTDHTCDCDVQGNRRCSSCGCDCNPWWSGLDFPEGARDLLWETNGDTNFFPASKSKLVQNASSGSEWLGKALPEKSYKDTEEIATALISSLSPVVWKREPTQLIWKDGSHSLASGQKLVVGQEQIAVMVSSGGKICDKLAAGEYLVSNATFPLLSLESRRSVPGFDHPILDGSPVFLSPNMEFEINLMVSGQTKTLRRVGAMGRVRMKLTTPEVLLQKLNSSGRNYDTQAVLTFVEKYSSDLLKKEMSLHEYDELKDNGALLVQKLSGGLRGDLGIETVKINFDSVGEFGPAMFMPSASQMRDPKNAEEMRKWADTMRQTQMAQIEAMKQMQQRMQSVQPTLSQGAGGNVCSSCGFQNPSISKFCGNCGKPLSTKRACPKCGQEVALGVKFCGNCGANLSA